MNGSGRGKNFHDRRGIGRKLPLLAVCVLGFQTARADTDWLILPRASESRRMLLHGIRDNTRPVSTDLRMDKSGKYHSLRIGSTKSKFTYAGINQCGVAAMAIGGDPQRDKPPKRD